MSTVLLIEKPYSELSELNAPIAEFHSLRPTFCQMHFSIIVSLLPHVLLGFQSHLLFLWVRDPTEHHSYLQLSL